MIAIVKNIMAPYRQKAMSGELPVKQAWDEAAEEAQKILTRTE